ncbi:hypothetical protein GMJAKD_07290 [Candidatus Electrothrix aarhusensis]
MFDRHEHQKTELQQHHSGTGDNVARDKIINIYVNAEDYKRLEKELFELKQNQEKLVQRIRTYPDDAEFQQDLIACNVKIADTQQEIEDFKADVFRLYEQFTRIPLNTERLRRAKEHFDKGEFREADAVLKAEEITAEVEQLQAVEKIKEEELAAVRKDLADRANEFLIKAQIALLSPPPEGSSRFEMAEGWLEQALATTQTAQILQEYAVFLSKHNAFSRAKPLYREAVEQLSRSGQANPEAFLANVAATLNNLANLHKARHEDVPALKKYKDALEAYRNLAEVNPEAFLPYVAMTLNNLAVLHSQREEYDPALAKYQEALKIRRALAETNLEAFLPDVAATLHDLASLHYQKKEYGPAVEGYQETLKIRRGLAKENPEVFLPDVAMTLNNLAALHYQTSEYDSALAEYEESLKIYRCFGKSNPKAFMSHVAGTLNNLASLHKETNQYGSAVKEYEEALEIYRSLDQDEPKAFLPNLAQALLNLSIFYLQAVPDKTKSIAYAQEARDILLPLCKQAPHLQKYLDMAEGLLKDNNTKPNA